MYIVNVKSPVPNFFPSEVLLNSCLRIALALALSNPVYHEQVTCLLNTYSLDDTGKETVIGVEHSSLWVWGGENRYH